VNFFFADDVCRALQQLEQQKLSMNPLSIHKIPPIYSDAYAASETAFRLIMKRCSTTFSLAHINQTARKQQTGFVQRDSNLGLVINATPKLLRDFTFCQLIAFRKRNAYL